MLADVQASANKKPPAMPLQTHESKNSGLKSKSKGLNSFLLDSEKLISSKIGGDSITFQKSY